VSALSLWKMALVVIGVFLVVLADTRGQRWLGYAGLGLIVIAFFLRFVRRPGGPEDAG